MESLPFSVSNFLVGTFDILKRVYISREKILSLQGKENTSALKIEYIDEMVPFLFVVILIWYW